MPLDAGKQLELEEELAQLEREKGIVAPESVHWLDSSANFRLKDALEYAASCEQFIVPEQERLYKLLAEAKSDVERAAREYQIEYVEKYLKRAADLARKRLAYLKTLKTQEDFEAENEKCAVDKVHWFQMYAWGYDPRARTPLSTVPFELYPRQQDLLHKLDEVVFEKRTSLLIEKARDEGATEECVRWGVHCWRYAKGFSMLLSTRTEDEVDTKKKQGTLFERMRFQIRLLPDWMLPKNFNVNKDLLPDMLISNTENGNALIGQAPVENMGRGDRVTCALFDEFAFWRFGGYPQFRSMSQTTDSIIMPSSVAGRLNQYADIASDGVTEKFYLDWRNNPFKDKRWYDSLPYGYISPKMSKTTIAQEVDRNYDAAQPGKVWQCPEPYVFITQSEFLKPFEKAGLKHKFFDDNGKFKIPDDWRVIRTSDYGKSEGHDWSYLIGVQPRAAYPLNDTHFIFVARILEPTGILTAEAVKLWREWEREYGLRGADGSWIHKPHASYHSHEQTGKNRVEGETGGLREVLLEKYGENWQAWSTSYNVGIEAIEEWWTPEDLLQPNPFRPELYGRCKLVFVAPDGEYQLAYNERLASHFVTISDSEAGFALARKQISAYHYPMSELGKAKKDMRPAKEFDDVVDAIRGYAVNWNRDPLPLTTQEKIIEAMPEAVKPKTIAEITDPALKVQTINASRIVHQQLIQKMNKPKTLNPISRMRQELNKR
jgi:hypothetical protein